MTAKFGFATTVRVAIAPSATTEIGRERSSWPRSISNGQSTPTSSTGISGRADTPVRRQLLTRLARS